MSVTELHLGVNTQYGTDKHRQAIEDLERLLSRFDIAVTRSVAITAVRIIAELRERGAPLHNLHDIYIGATARTERLAVLTANVDYFDRINHVQVVD